MKLGLKAVSRSSSSPQTTTIAALPARDPGRVSRAQVDLWLDDIDAASEHHERFAGTVTAFASAIKAMFITQRPTNEALDAVRAPVLVLWGSDDPLVEGGKALCTSVQVEVFGGRANYIESGRPPYREPSWPPACPTAAWRQTSITSLSAATTGPVSSAVQARAGRRGGAWCLCETCSPPSSTDALGKAPQTPNIRTP